MNDMTAFGNAAVAFVATYFVHSTLLLSACWLVMTFTRAKSHFLIERMWKMATVLGIATAFVQVAVGPIALPRLTPSDSEPLAFIDVSARSETGATAGSVETDFTSSANSIDIPPPSVSTIENIPLSDVIEVENGTNVAQASEWPLPEEAAQFTLPNRDSNVVLDRAEVTLDEVSREPFAPQSASHLPGEAVVLSFEARVQSWLPALLQTSAIVLMFGFTGGCLLLCMQTMRLRLRFGRAQVLRSGTARTALDRFLKRNKIRRSVRLLTSSKHTEPIAYGLFWWTIVLPDATEARLERNELKALLAHEVAHLIRGDVLWLWIGRVLCTCCAFQPLNFVARRQWQQAAEYLCDEWAIARGVRSLSLARCLTRVAEWRFGIESPDLGLAAGGSKATLVGRVQRLVEERQPRDSWQTPRRRRLLTMGAAIAVVALVGFAPRVALPLTLLSEGASDVNPELIEPSVNESVASDWHALEEELLQLDADLEKVAQLRGTDDTSELISQFENLNRRAAALQTRREFITSLLEKESQR